MRCLRSYPRLRAIQLPPKFKVSNVDKYEPKQDPGYWGNIGCHDSVPAHCPRAGHATVALASTVALHRRLGRLQPSVCREFPIPL
jgi:hypothetical protein